MKKLLVLLALTLTMSLFMTSGKDDEPTGPSNVELGEMSATVGGSDFKAGNAYYYNTVNQISGGQQVGGLTNLMDVNTISIQLVQVGGEPMVKSYSAICYYQESRGMTPNTTVKQWNTTSGTCEITEVTDKYVKGEFSFTGTNEDDNSTKTVSGKFYTPRQ